MAERCQRQYAALHLRSGTHWRSTVASTLASNWHAACANREAMLSRGILLGGGVLCLTLGVLYVLGNRWIAGREPDATAELPIGVPGSLVAVDGHRVHVIDQGTGSPLLLVHGTAGTTFDWEQHALPAFARRHRVIAVDLYGMGFSERSDRFDYGVDLWAAQLVATLEALGITRAAVVGHSLGGAIAARLAADYPQKVDRLVSVDSGPWMPWFLFAMVSPGVGEAMFGRMEFWPDLPGAPPEYTRRMRQLYRIKGTRQALLSYARGIPGDGRRYFATFPRIAAPTLLLHGGADPIIPVRAAASLQRVIPNSRMIVIEGAGHFLMNDAPDRFVAEVETFLDGE